MRLKWTPKFIGRCSKTSRMIPNEGSAVVVGFYVYCDCHDLPVVPTNEVDAIDKRDDGQWYWVRRGP